MIFSTLYGKKYFFFMTLEEENEKLVCFGFTRNLCQSSLFTVSDEILEFRFFFNAIKQF